MVGAAGLMAEVSWKVLERRARAKRSGLAGWSATPLPRIRVVLPLKRLGWEAGGGPGVEPGSACVPLESRRRSLGLPPYVYPHPHQLVVAPTLLHVFFTNALSYVFPLGK